MLREWLARAGYQVFNTSAPGLYARDGLFTYHRQPFLACARFQRAYARGVAASAGYNPNTHWRVHTALWAAERALHAAGDFVECGVNAGFVSSAILTYLGGGLEGRTFHLVDTFAGPVMAQFAGTEDRQLSAVRTAMAAGSYVTNVERAIANFAEWPAARVVQGVVPDVLAELGAERVAFLHVDMHCAFPEREAFRHFWPRLTPGGVVLFDDYTYSGHDSLTQALDAVAVECGTSILALPTGQGLVWKTA